MLGLKFIFSNKCFKLLVLYVACSLLHHNINSCMVVRGHSLEMPLFQRLNKSQYCVILFVFFRQQALFHVLAAYSMYNVVSFFIRCFLHYVMQKNDVYMYIWRVTPNTVEYL